ncbi:MAG: hypothetical protein ACJAR2_002899 [Ilumatobacter sp.]|jgi:hypothetical protein
MTPCRLVDTRPTAWQLNPSDAVRVSANSTSITLSADGQFALYRRFGSGRTHAEIRRTRLAPALVCTHVGVGVSCTRIGHQESLNTLTISWGSSHWHRQGTDRAPTGHCWVDRSGAGRTGVASGFRPDCGAEFVECCGDAWMLAQPDEDVARSRPPTRSDRTHAQIRSAALQQPWDNTGDHRRAWVLHASVELGWIGRACGACSSHGAGGFGWCRWR